MKLQYCTQCLYPSTKPRLTFNAAGVCSACTAFEARQQIDWVKRERDFRGMCEDIHAVMQQEGISYDCIVPVSGGKDSTFQVLKVLEYGLRPLAITAMTDHLTDLGWRNLRNIANLGVDHIMVQTNMRLRRRINKYTLQTVGDISWAEHITIFTVPFREAVARGIPLIFFGENPENEYGGPNDAQHMPLMRPDWLQEFGGLNGLRVSDLVDAGVATKEDLFQYSSPFGTADSGSHPAAAFLGHYFPWDGAANVEIAEAHGFEAVIPCGGQMRGENLDNAQTGIHDRFKYLKFGFGRVTDHCNNAIRRGRMTRQEGLALVRKHDGAYPLRYMGTVLQAILAAIGMTVDEYNACEYEFMNPSLFRRDGDRIVPKFQPE